MLNKICLYINGSICMFCMSMCIMFVYLTRVGFYNGKHGFILITLAIIGAVGAGMAAVRIEKIIENKRK